MRIGDIGKRISYWMKMNNDRVLVFDGIYQGSESDHYRIFLMGECRKF